jgi:hypothetical protein
MGFRNILLSFLDRYIVDICEVMKCKAKQYYVK